MKEKATAIAQGAKSLTGCWTQYRDPLMKMSSVILMVEWRKDTAREGSSRGREWEEIPCQCMGGKRTTTLEASGPTGPAMSRRGEEGMAIP